METAKLKYLKGEAVMTVDGRSLRLEYVDPVDVPIPTPVPPIWNWPRPTTGIFVAHNGALAGSGTITNPLSLERALAIGGPGQQIWLRGGSYAPANTLSPRMEGSVTQPWKISAYPGEEVVIDCKTESRHGMLLNSLAMAFQRWTGIRFTDLSSTPASPTAYQLVKLDSSNEISFFGCQFDNCKRSGVIANGPARNTVLYGCLILNNGDNTQFDHGIYAKSLAGSFTVANCVLLNNAGHQLHGYNGSSSNLEAIKSMKAFDNSILTYGEPSDRAILFQDGGVSKSAIDCEARRNVYYNQFPPPVGDATDEDRSSIKIVSGSNCHITDNCVWGGLIVKSGGVTDSGNRVITRGNWPAAETWVRQFTYDDGLAHVTIWNPALLPSVSVMLGAMPAGNYEIRAASSPQKIAAKVAHGGIGSSVLFPTAGLTYDSQHRAGGYNWKGTPKANAFIVRRVP